MAQPVLELEGTWEELAVQAERFKGHRLRLIVLPDTENGVSPNNSNQSMSAKLAEIRGEDPAAWEQAPEDLAEQHDHYVYGWPKR